jgi:REP element-mobilizing transposase RayT
MNDNCESQTDTDRFQVMPNHFHGLISILPQASGSVVSADLHQKRKPARLYPDSLGSVVGQFKGACTARIRKEVNPSFQWQERFRDQVVHNEQQLNELREYIGLNPRRWEMKRRG